MFSLLNNEEKELILTLTAEFNHYNFEQYLTLTRECIDHLDSDFLNLYSGIYIFPLLSPKDAKKNKLKSGSTIAYLIEVELQKVITNSRALHRHDRISSLLQSYSTRGASLIILVDDFIGSGETASEAIEEYFNYYRKPEDDLVVLTLASMKEGYEKIQGLAYQTISARIHSKGIHDNTSIPDKQTAYETMRGIEQRLAVSTDYHLGFAKSEGLISMIRTPNNTFPLYWCNKQLSGDPWPNPFDR